MPSNAAARPQTPRGYGELGDLLGALMRRPASLQVCAFCMTARHGAGPCEVCGARPAPGTVSFRDDAPAHRAPQTASPVSAAPAVARLLAQVLLLPVLLFAGFGLWYADHRTETAATPLAFATPPIASHAGERYPITEWRGFHTSSVRAVAPDATLAAPVVAEPVKTAYVQKPRASEATRSTAEAMETVPMSTVAACGGRNFLMRAVCVNDFCAQPAHRRLAQCAQAIAQRQIDEQRRDGVLLN